MTPSYCASALRSSKRSLHLPLNSSLLRAQQVFPSCADGISPIQSSVLTCRGLTTSINSTWVRRAPPSRAQRPFTSSTCSAAPADAVSPSPSSAGHPAKEKLVILGSGWGGFTLLKSLDKSKYDVHVISPNTYFAMTPLLAQAAVGSLNFRAVMEPVRSSSDVTFHHAWVDELDIANRKLKLMPAYPPAFREVEPPAPAAEQQHNVTPEPTVQNTNTEHVQASPRVPSAVPPHSDKAKQAAHASPPAGNGAKMRMPVSRGGYATTFKKPTHRRDVEGSTDNDSGSQKGVNTSNPSSPANPSPKEMPTPPFSGQPDDLPQQADHALAAEEGRHYTIDFDKLVISVGAYNRTFGISGVKDHAWFLKDSQNARSIRWRILETLEQASHPEVPEAEKRKLLSWVVVGGGPTGSELIGEIHNLVSKDLKRIFPKLAPLISLTLVDSANAILNTFDERLSEYAREKFLKGQIDVRLKRTIEGVEPGVLHIKEDGPLPFGLLVWSTGITSNPLIRSIKQIRKERKTVSLLTDDQLRALKAKEGEEFTDLQPLPASANGKRHGKAGGKSPSALTEEDEAYDNIWAIGDCAIIQGRMMPATAQVASAKAKHLASILNGDVDDEEDRYFRHASKGAMTNLGGSQGIFQSSTTKLSGYSAWLLWRGAYWWLSMSARNRVFVPFNWLLTAIFGRDVSRF